ncbi:hypothetical protein AcV7_009824 [Taiwanofungus camphoratus]|nr:hypothetical protein AcW2_007317 [Antrodia cinnamomea]KAI0947383.1 hypothetical protein AcV7_009824 [Antrodia cinnamomea]
MPFPKSATLRSSGVKLVDCRHEGRKDVADKALKEDMLAYAAHNPAPITILLISGDHGFTDSVRTLAQQGYHIVLFAPTAANQDLKAQANVVHAWPQDVIPKFGNLTIRANAT